MTVPPVMRMFGQQAITQSADRVRAAAASARVRAIETGIVYQFCCESGGGHFAVVPFEPDHLNSKNGQHTGTGNILGRYSGHLGKGIVFSPVKAGSLNTGSSNSGSTTTSANSPATGVSHRIAPTAFDGLPNGSDLAGLNWSIPILFNPDGSASMDAEVMVSDKRAQQVKLRIRALTGSAILERLSTGKR